MLGNFDGVHLRMAAGLVKRLVVTMKIKSIIAQRPASASSHQSLRLRARSTKRIIATHRAVIGKVKRTTNVHLQHSSRSQR